MVHQANQIGSRSEGLAVHHALQVLILVFDISFMLLVGANALKHHFAEVECTTGFAQDINHLAAK